MGFVQWGLFSGIVQWGCSVGLFNGVCDKGFVPKGCDTCDKGFVQWGLCQRVVTITHTYVHTYWCKLNTEVSSSRHSNKGITTLANKL